MTRAIKPLDAGSLAGLRALFLRQEHNIYRHAFRVEAGAIADEELRRLEESLTHGAAAVVHDGDGPCGVIAVTASEWESRHYPFALGKLATLAASGSAAARRDAYTRLLDWVVAQAGPQLGLRHLSCRVPVEDVPLVHALEDRGFRHMSTMIQTFWKQRPETPRQQTPGWVVRAAVEADWPHLTPIIRDVLSSTLTRYTADPNLPESGTRALYESWAVASASGEFSDVNLVVVKQGHETEPGRYDGFAFGRFNPTLGRLLGGKVGDLTIGGINPAHRGRGAFHAIVPALVWWLWDHGAKHVAMLTQAQNYGSLRVAQRIGGQFAGAHHCFHRLLP